MVNNTQRRKRHARRGFTVVEVLIAVTVLVVGVMGMMGTSAAITAMLSRGARSNRAAYFAQARLERLQSTPCQLLADGTETQATYYTLAWTVTTPAATTGKRVRLISTYPGVIGNARADTVEATVLCIR